MTSRTIGKLLVFVAGLVLTVGCAFGSTHTSGSLKRPSSKATMKGWVPSLADVKRITLTLGGDPLLDLQATTGPIQIYPTSPKGKALIEHLLRLLAQAKKIPSSTANGPAGVGESHALLFELKNGKSLAISQSYESTGEVSPTAVDASFEIHGPPNSTFGGGTYEDPALAQWLGDEWSKDTQALAKGWTCASGRPPDGIYANQISGFFTREYADQINGNLTGSQPWEFVASSQSRCVTLYTRKNGAWASSVVTEHGPLGAAVEQAQFVDATHGLVLVGGPPGTGTVPRRLYATSDGGVTWHALPASGPFPMSDTSVQMRFTSPEDGWLTTVNNSYSPARVYVYRTTNGGQSWTAAYFTLSSVVTLNGHFHYKFATLDSANGLTGTIAVFGPSTGIAWFDSTDGGVRWKYDQNANG